MYLYFSILEQFDILPFFNLQFFRFDISLTNQTFFLFLILIFLFFFYYCCLLNEKDNTLFIIPTRLQLIMEILFSLFLSMVVKNVKGVAQNYFPLIFFIFFFILSMNIMGLFPYSFTITSHCVITLVLSYCLFFSLTVSGIIVNKENFLALFYPSGVPIALGFFIVPLEIILYFFRPLSLCIRLFCNLFSGHILLKLVIGLVWWLIYSSGIYLLPCLVVSFFVVILFIFEFIIAFLQAFIFSLLITIYLNDAMNLG